MFDEETKKVVNEKVKYIVRYAAKLLYRECNKGNQRKEFWEESEIVRLAIKLAELRAQDDPQPYLTEAASLLTKAREARLQETLRPEREKKEAEEVLDARIAEHVESETIPFDKIYRPGKQEGGEATQDQFESFEIEIKPKKPWDDKGNLLRPEVTTFHWKVYTSERGFTKLLEKHANRIVQKAKNKLKPILCCAKPDNKRAANLLRDYWRKNEHFEELAKIKNRKQAEEFLENWINQSVPETAKYLREQAEEGTWTVPTLYSVYCTRKNLD